MLTYVLRRLFYAIPIALAVSLVCFSLVHLAPGDVVSAVIPADAPVEVAERLKHDYGLDKPLPVQFALWVQRAATGDLGFSIASGRPVLSELSGALANTFMIAIAGATIGFSVGCLLGAIAGVYQHSAADKVATTLSITGVSLPHYWLGMVLVILFAVGLDWFPAMGAGAGGSADWRWDWEHVRYMVLPAITLCFVPMGIVARTLRGIVAETLNQEFVQALRAKGLGGWRITLHIAKNAAPTLMAVMGLQLGYMLGGSILVETVFSWPGSGALLNQAIFTRDLPLLQGTILVLAMIFMAINLIVDLLQMVVDPRILRT